MFIKLFSQDKNLSWLIVKHPQNVFMKELTKYRTVSGKFVDDTFFGEIINDDRLFIKHFKKQNADTYVTPLQWAVTPYNLQMMNTLFASVLNGNNGSKTTITQEQFNNESLHGIEIGPFINPPESFITFLREKINYTIDALEPGAVVTLTFANNAPETLTKFLQTVYVCSYILSAKLDFNHAFKHELKQEQMLRYAPWLDDEDARSVIRILSKYKSKIFNTFTDKLETEFEQKETLHEQRLAIAAEYINYSISVAQRDELAQVKVLDLGCGTAKLRDKLTKSNKLIYFGIERNPRRIAQFIKQTNLLAPNIREEDLQPDWLVLSEVIEHLNQEERAQLIDLVINFYQPEQIFLSTPNVDYNVNYGLAEGEYRHSDHKIEYNHSQFIEEVVSKLSDANYVVHRKPLLDGEKIQPSFIIIAKYNGEERKKNTRLLQKFQRANAGFFLPFSKQKIKDSTVEIGMLDKFLSGAFYHGPPIAPVEWSEDSPKVLEDITTALEYYTTRGCTELIIEEKVMGSRAYILAHRSPKEGEEKIQIRTRRNAEFFKNEPEILEKIYDEIFQNIPNWITTIMLDCEITPWSLKAGWLIENKFKQPVIAARLHKLNISANANIENEVKFLNTLESFSKDSPLRVHVFDILLLKGIDKKDLLIGPLLSKQEVNRTIDTFFSGLEIFTPVKYIVCDTMIDSDIDAAKCFFKKLNTAEGVVVKPNNRFGVTGNGWLLQPALKVRHPEYLRLIYGVNYLDYLDILKVRNIKRKRQQAIIEYELSVNALLANSYPYEQKKYLAAALAIENENLRYIDATL